MNEILPESIAGRRAALPDLLVCTTSFNVGLCVILYRESPYVRWASSGKSLSNGVDMADSDGRKQGLELRDAFAL